MPNDQIVIRGAREHNLKNIDAAFPLGVLVAVTGVSGAGKSSLINGILQPALRRKLLGSYDQVGKHAGLTGIDASLAELLARAGLRPGAAEPKEKRP